MNQYRICLLWKDGQEKYFEIKTTATSKEIAKVLKSKDKNNTLHSVVVKSL